MRLLDVMHGIEDRLKTIEGLRTSATMPGTIMPPTAIIGIPPVADYHAQLGRSRMHLEPTIRIFTSEGWERSGEELLTEFANDEGPRSIIRAIEADRSLGGACGDCTVHSFRPLTDAEFGEIGYCGGVFTLRVF